MAKQNGAKQWFIQIFASGRDGNMGVVDIWRESSGKPRHLHASLLPAVEKEVLQAFMDGAIGQIYSSSKARRMSENQIKNECIAMAKEQIGLLVAGTGPLTIGNGKVKMGVWAELSTNGLSVLNTRILPSNEEKWLGSGRMRYRITRESQFVRFEFLTGAAGSKLIFYCVELGQENYDKLLKLLINAAEANAINSDSIRDYVHPYFKTESFDYIPDLQIDE